MTSVTATDTPTARSARTPSPSLVIRAVDLVASEWTKFRSVRSSFWSLLVAVVTPIGVSALVAFVFASQPASAGPPPDPLLPEVAQPGVRGDRRQRHGRAGLQRRVQHRADPHDVHRGAAPPRGARGQGGRPRDGDARRRRTGRLHVVLPRPGHPGRSPPGRVAVPARRARGGAGGRDPAVRCTMLGLALGSIIRHTAGGIAATIGVILLPAILGLLPAPWNGRIGRFTLLDAARQVTALHPAANLFSPALSLLVLLAWPAAALAVAAILITRQDI